MSQSPHSPGFCQCAICSPLSLSYSFDPGGITFSMPSPPMPALPPAPAKKESLLHENREEPIRALKAAFVVATRSAVTFASLNTATPYAAEAVAECRCGDGSLYYGGMSMRAMLGMPEDPAAKHSQPDPDNRCGFYAWKYSAQFPFESARWLLEVDLYGRVIEHEHGYRAQKQRVLRASPLPDVLCEPPYSLVAAHDGNAVTVRCDSCPDIAGHPVTPDRLRSLLGVEIDMTWAQEMRDAA